MAVQIVNSIVNKALERGATDIHCDAAADGCLIRYRIDGTLFQDGFYPADLALQIGARFKVLAGLDIAERRLPQDGKFMISGVDFRVATFPSLYGEKIAIRILDRSNHVFESAALGLTGAVGTQLLELIERPQGFLLVTGPTGSGKTTTLYTLLSTLIQPDKNIITLEDPIEYTFAGITQSQVQPEIGFTFARGIRSLVRQDPDVIMVGEIRDRETAEVAIQAALTGHYLLSTLHTSDAPSAIIRLRDMGVEPFLIDAVLSGVLTQRLVRLLCQECRDRREPDCAACFGRGYRGRTGIFELLVSTPELRALIMRGGTYEQIREQALMDGMRSLWDDGMGKVEAGLISKQELMRVVAG